MMLDKVSLSRIMTPPRYHLLNLPIELLCKTITCIRDAKSTLAFMHTCKMVYSLYDNKTKYGRQVWKGLREGEGWPNPASVNITDFDFIRAIYQRGCIDCSKHPKIRTPIWAFGGMRLCQECLPKATVSGDSYEAPAFPKHLLACVPYHYDLNNQRYYLRRDLARVACGGVLTTRQKRTLPAWKQQNAITEFTFQVNDHLTSMADKRWHTVRKLQRARAKAIKRWIRSSVEVNSSWKRHFYKEMDSYKATIRLASPFVGRSATLFKNKFLKELESYRPSETDGHKT